MPILRNPTGTRLATRRGRLLGAGECVEVSEEEAKDETGVFEVVEQPTPPTPEPFEYRTTRKRDGKTVTRTAKPKVITEAPAREA